MNSKERFYATIKGEKVDRPASWLGLPEHHAIPKLLEYFKVSSVEEMKMQLDDDIWPVEVPVNCPPYNHIACAFNFAKTLSEGANEERTLTAPGFFEDYSNPSDVDKFNWPDPAKIIDRAESLTRAKAIPDGKVRMGIMWSAHFQDACAAFGMEQALMIMMTNPEMFKAVLNRIVDFYLEANQIFYEATKGYLDVVLIGNDFGSQNGLIVAPESLNEFVFEGTKKLIDQAKSFGLKVMHHSCGSIFPVINDLINIGTDIIHPIQALAKDMNAPNLKNHFDGKVAFCGGIDAQFLLVKGSPREIRSKVHELKSIFPTGLVFSPSHEAILPDINPANIEAIFDALKQ